MATVTVATATTTMTPTPVGAGQRVVDSVGLQVGLGVLGGFVLVVGLCFFLVCVCRYRAGIWSLFALRPPWKADDRSYPRGQLPRRRLFWRDLSPPARNPYAEYGPVLPLSTLAPYAISGGAALPLSVRMVNSPSIENITLMGSPPNLFY